ncbi:MAG: hypothetical protein M3P87_09205, partial [Actinomycetota bacterium]|nr:hypothetical protein [Actinomycetota bacterium]
MGVSPIISAQGPIGRYIRQHPVVSLFYVIMICCGAATLIFPQAGEAAGFLGYGLGTTSAGFGFVRGARKLQGRER